MYQYNTFYPLAKSKIYINSIEEATSILRKVINLTNQFRRGKNQFALSVHEIENGQRLLKIHADEMGEMPNFLGDECPITLENLRRPNPSC